MADIGQDNSTVRNVESVTPSEGGDTTARQGKHENLSDDQLADAGKRFQELTGRGGKDEQAGGGAKTSQPSDGLPHARRAGDGDSAAQPRNFGQDAPRSAPQDGARSFNQPADRSVEQRPGQPSGQRGDGPTSSGIGGPKISGGQDGASVPESQTHGVDQAGPNQKPGIAPTPGGEQEIEEQTAKFRRPDGRGETGGGRVGGDRLAQSASDGALTQGRVGAEKGAETGVPGEERGLPRPGPQTQGPQTRGRQSPAQQSPAQQSQAPQTPAQQTPAQQTQGPQSATVRATPDQSQQTQSPPRQGPDVRPGEHTAKAQSGDAPPRQATMGPGPNSPPASRDGRPATMGPDASPAAANPGSHQAQANPGPRPASIGPDQQQATTNADARTATANPDARTATTNPDARPQPMGATTHPAQTGPAQNQTLGVRGTGEMPRTDHPEDSEALAGSIAATAGDRTLSGLQGTAAQSTAAAAQAGGHDPKLNEIIEKMVDRILVSEPKAGESKVMIRMNAPSLEGTEITLSRDAGGLTVRIEAPPDVAQRLSQGQHVLQQMLENKTTGPVQVEVGTRSDGGTEDNQDGRSRNRRDIREEQEDAE